LKGRLLRPICTIAWICCLARVRSSFLILIVFL